jgi:hypothetical protein
MHYRQLHLPTGRALERALDGGPSWQTIRAVHTTITTPNALWPWHSLWGAPAPSRQLAAATAAAAGPGPSTQHAQPPRCGAVSYQHAQLITSNSQRPACNTPCHPSLRLNTNTRNPKPPNNSQHLWFPDGRGGVALALAACICFMAVSAIPVHDTDYPVELPSMLVTTHRGTKQGFRVASWAASAACTAA